MRKSKHMLEALEEIATGIDSKIGKRFDNFVLKFSDIRPICYIYREGDIMKSDNLIRVFKRRKNSKTRFFDMDTRQPCDWNEVKRAYSEGPVLIIDWQGYDITNATLGLI